MRLIDADKLLRDIEHYHLSDGKFQHWVEVQPTIERKTGKWIPFDIPWYQCSECGAVREHKSFMENFCPNCGADMRGETDETN